MEHSCSGIISRINAGHCETLPHRVMLGWCFQWIHTPVSKIIHIFLCLKLSKKANGFTLVSWSCTWTFRSVLHICLFVFDHLWIFTRCLNVSLNSTSFSGLILVFMLLLKGNLFFSAWVSLNEVYLPKCSMFTWKTTTELGSVLSFSMWGLKKSLDSWICYDWGDPGRVY